MNNVNNYFYCYSIKLLQFLKINGFRYEYTNMNPKTNKSYWIFIRTPELMKEITNFTNEKQKYLGLTRNS